MQAKEKSKVYFTTMKATPDLNLLQKLERLITKTGIEQIDFKDKFVAIKIHFGEPGNLSYLRANYAKVVVDKIKALGGKAFLTDCNTLYVGRRKNALEHLDAAYENGFSPFSTGCHIIIADGLKGTDEALVQIDGEYIKEAKIGQAIYDADIIISLNHFKGHEATGFGGALKNIGMGCGSRAGKMEMHNAGKPFIEQSSCIGCAMCQKICAHSAITITNKLAEIDHEKCVGCGRCIGVCPKDAVSVNWDEADAVLTRKISEYTLAVIKDKPNFHINLVMDVSPNCDCHAENDIAIIPNIGMFASFDPVALDVACADACNKQNPIAGSLLAESKEKFDDHFKTVHSNTDWREGTIHAEKIGIGCQSYELVEI